MTEDRQYLINLIDAVKSADEDMSPDEIFAEAGIATDYTVENLCAVCGNTLTEPYIEIEGHHFGRPDTTVAAHNACARVFNGE